MSLRKLSWTMLALAAFFAASSATEAASFVPGFNGSIAENPTFPGTATGQVYSSFSVVDAGPGGAAAFVAGLGGTLYAGSGTGAGDRYVYMYEVVNKSSTAVGSLSIVTNHDLYGSFGQIATKVFVNQPSGNKVGPTDNGFILTGSTTTANFVGVAATSKGPDLSNTVNFIDNTNVVFHWDPDRIVQNGGYTDIVFMTSQHAPTYTQSFVQDGFPFGPGLIPAAVPEPTAMALMGLGALGMGGYAGLRRRFRKA